MVVSFAEGHAVLKCSYSLTSLMSTSLQGVANVVLSSEKDRNPRVKYGTTVVGHP